MAAKPGSRKARREALLEAARAVELPEYADVCVVGGGAAGLVAAICAAEQGARTVVIEANEECGRTILATGGGRCNFANRDLAASHYNNPGFVEAVVGDDFLGSVLRFFRACGLAWTDEDGWLFPASFSAASVRDVLVARAKRAGVILACARVVSQISMSDDEWFVRVDGVAGEEELDAGAVVLASGATGVFGCFKLGLNMKESSPVLCPVDCVGLPFPQLDGQRVRAEVRLLRAGEEIARESGELLFRSYGVSGICAFNLSRHAELGDVLVFDLAPTLDESQLEHLAERAGSFAGIVPPQVAAVLEQHGATAADLKGLRCMVTGLAETDRAQVTRGGLATSNFDPQTLVAVTRPGIFAAGEALDIDGPCGGYNLAWAWASGQVAGTSAAAWALDPEARGTRA